MEGSGDNETEGQCKGTKYKRRIYGDRRRLHATGLAGTSVRNGRASEQGTKLGWGFNKVEGGMKEVELNLSLCVNSERDVGDKLNALLVENWCN